MSLDEIAAAHRRTVERVMSDESLLGALPEEDAQRLLDWTVRRLRVARDAAGRVSEYETAADAVIQEARRHAEEAAAGAPLAPLLQVGEGTADDPFEREGSPAAVPPRSTGMQDHAPETGRSASAGERPLSEVVDSMITRLRELFQRGRPT